MRHEANLPIPEMSLIGIAAVWGLTFVLVQDAIAFLPVMTFLAYRFIPASVIVGIAFFRQVRRLPPSGWVAGAAMGVFLTGGYVFQTLGLERTTAANAGFITGLWVVLTPVFGALFFNQRASRPVWIAAAVSLGGLFLLTGAGAGGLHLAGDLLVLICASSFTFHIFATDRGVRHHDVGALVAIQLGIVGVFSLVVAAASADLEVPRTAVEWNALLLTSLAASALGFFVQTYAQRRASPARTALILASEPAFAGLFAYVLAGERLGAFGWLGAALILGAILSVEALPHVKLARPVPELDRPLPEFD